jgi:hypothetical protein
MDSENNIKTGIFETDNTSEESLNDQTNSPKYWEKLLANEGMPSELPNLQRDIAKKTKLDPSQIVSVENQRSITLDIQEGIDRGVETENLFSSEIPLNKSGLPPCLRAKAEANRGIDIKDFKLKDN